jgi:hypothetical protein
MKKKYRKSISGHRLLENDSRTLIQVITLCPAKWVVIDTECGHIYGKKENDKGWIQPPIATLKDARLALTREIAYRSRA